ncbi:MAG: sigma-54-dependent Fis family transcriptional regulator [Nitrospirae bacterium]|nr:MAG: sigma-54-dependent Fis family transcriptional regulator [Nitrospirota bacterium]
MEMERTGVLIVDDDPDMRNLLQDILQDHRYHVVMAANGQEALRQLDAEDCRVVVSDLRMKGMDGLELLHHVTTKHPECNVIIMTAFGTVETAVEAMKQGAFDYLTKPIKTEELLVTVDKAMREALLRREVEQLRRQVSREYAFDQILGKSKPMRELFELIRRVADSQTNILLTGESGTGKELVAKAIHFNSQRKSAPFVPVNCAAIPELLLESELFGHVKGAFTDAKIDKRGLFEEAQGGTLFLDEISEMSMMLQAKLLRAVQEREIRRVGATRSIPIDVRIIAATNVKLAEEVKAKRFREDLYYRLNVIELRLPPLRERKEDIPLLVQGLLSRSQAAKEKGIEGLTEPALARLIDYDWPGNVRELENVIERAATLAREKRITLEDLPPTIRDVQGEGQMVEDAAERLLPLEDLERTYIRRILDKMGGNKYRAAQVLGIDRKTLYRKLGEMGNKEREKQPQ